MRKKIMKHMRTDLVELACHGKALGPIVIHESADRVTRFAADELKKYLRGVSGAGFIIRRMRALPSPDMPCLILGAGQWESQLGLRLDSRGNTFDGFLIGFRGHQVLIRGHNSRSTLYGVYAVLEDLGCRFVEPGIEHVPRMRTLALRRRDRREVAAFPLRTVYPNLNAFQKNEPFTGLDREELLPQIDWMAKRRLNHYDFYVNFYRYELWERHKHKILDDMLDRGFDLEVTHHSIQYFCPPDANHDFGDYGPSTYIQNHPDWHIPGLECTGRGTWQTAVEKPAVQKIIIERFLGYLDRNPELKICGLWPADIPINRPYRNLSHTDGYLTFWNRVADALAGTFPDKLLGIIAYFDLTTPPQKIKPRNNLHCWFCPISRNLAYPINDPHNRKFLAWQKGWIETMPPYHVANFEYYGWQMPMKPNRLSMAEDLPVYRDLKLGGIYGWCGFVNNLMGSDYRWAIDMHALAHLLWDPSVDIHRLDEIWAKGVFGSAGSDVLEFHEFLRKAYARETRKGLAPNYEWVAMSVLHRAQQILARAHRKVDSPMRKRRLAYLEKVLCRGCTEEVRRTGDARVV